MLKTMRPRYTAPKISVIHYLFGYFSLLLGFYGRHRTSALYQFPWSIGPRYNGAAVYLINILGMKLFGEDRIMLHLLVSNFTVFVNIYSYKILNWQGLGFLHFVYRMAINRYL